MKQFRLLFAAILLWAGVASSYANSGYNDHGTRDISGVTYHLYYFWSNYFGETRHGVAYVEGFDSSYSGSEITILESITDDGESYKVEWLRYNPAISSRTNTLSSSTVQTIHFQSWPAFNPDASSPTFDCPNLKTIYFEGASPSFYASYESYFKSPGKNNITVWVSDKTPEEITALRTNSAVWCDFAAVNLIPNANVKRNVFLTISNARMYVDQGSTSVPYIADKELQVDLYSNLSFRIDKTYGSGNPYEVMSVKLNGQEFLGEMHDSGTYYWYDLQNITNDVFISVASENTKYEASVICNDGGTCYSSDAVIYGGVIQPGDRQTIRWDKSNADGSNLQIRPKEGYTLDHFYYNSYDNTNRVTHNSDGTYTYNLTGNAEISVVFKSAGENILFADSNVKAICVANWDTNGDGELSKAEAAAVTTLINSETGKSVFYEKGATITSFDEFQYFTGLTVVETDAFYNDSLTSIVLPPTITAIQTRAFSGNKSLKNIRIPEGVKTIGVYAFNNTYSLEHITLPESLEAIDAYAFFQSSLKQLYIPKNVNSLGGSNSQNPFMRCKNLISIEVDKDNTTFNSGNHCNAIISSGTTPMLYVGCQTTVIPQDLKKGLYILESSFASIDLKKIVIPANLGRLYDGAFESAKIDTIVLKMKTPIEYKHRYFAPSSGSTKLADCIVIVPYGTKDAYVQNGWVGEGDEGTQVVKKVIEAAPELNAVIVPADGQYIKVFTDEDDDNYLAYGNETFTCGMEKGGTYKIGVGYKSVSENNLYINGVKQTEFVDNGDGYLTYTVTNVTEDMLIEAKYADTEWNIPICATLGGITSVYYQKTDGMEHSLSYNTSETTIFELREVKPGEPIRFLIEPSEGYELFMVFCGWERSIGAEVGDEVKPLEDGSYEFTLPAYQITTDKTTPIIIYKKIGEDVNYDLNGDGTVNVVDLTKLVDYILHH
ncbi:MAG: leucine-rich repeat protein [Prevotella sp.]|nr:leucine-rich repeat protein [Prevotella sp.]